LLDSAADSDGSGTGWGAWAEWRRSLGLADEPSELDASSESLSFNYGHLTLQAAAQGLGIALARAVLVADDLAAGRLLRAGPALPLMPARYAYYLVSREEPDARSRALATGCRPSSPRHCAGSASPRDAGNRVVTGVTRRIGP
jgi:LysR family glycine cleavage system transcriptional activator